MSLPIKHVPGGARFSVRVTPRASRTALTGVLGVGDQASIKVALNAPPVDGKANTVLIEFLAELLGVPRSSVEIAASPQSRNKLIHVRGQTAAEVAAILERALGRIRV